MDVLGKDRHKRQKEKCVGIKIMSQGTEQKKARRAEEQENGLYEGRHEEQKKTIISGLCRKANNENGRTRGKPRKRWMNCLKENMRRKNINKQITK